MAVPKKRTSKRRRDMRRAHDAIHFSGAVEVCPECAELKLYHRVCESCGYYRGRKVLEVVGS